MRNISALFKFSIQSITGLLFISQRNCEAADGGVLSAFDKEELLDHHNEERSWTALGKTGTQPMATNMKKLIWDEDLADAAKVWADRCKFEHNHDSGMGENLAVAGAFTDVVDNLDTLINGIDEWYEEHLQYDFNTGECSEGQCGHYTQSVWANTFRMGCGYAECPFPDFFLPTQVNFGILLVCRYSPRGNFIGQTPYNEAKNLDEVVSECESGFEAVKETGLCESDATFIPPDDEVVLCKNVLKGLMRNFI